MISQENIALVQRNLKADLAFLMYLIERKCNVVLIENTGLKKLIDDCNSFLDSSAITNVDLIALNAATSLIASLKILWRNNIEFCQQLKACNTGDYEYGKLSSGGKHFYKDFEFELWSAALMVRNGLKVALPQRLDSNDILYDDIEVQCKHPDVFDRDRVDKYLREFTKSLNTRRRYGVFGIAIEDCFHLQLGEFAST